MAPTVLDATDAQRLLSCMQLGIVIQHANGHRYIEADGVPGCEGPEDEPESYGISDGPPPLNWQLKQAGEPPIRSKQYGSLRDCLDVIDTALRVLGQSTLLERYTKGDAFGRGDAAWGLK